MERIYHHYKDCEENAAGMWRVIAGKQRDSFIISAATLMRDLQAFKFAMRRAISEWPNSCEMNMTSPGVNRQAWLGHAGCCLATGAPEELTRLGWHTLNQTEQDEANRVADEVIAEWEEKHEKKGISCQSALWE